MVHKNNCTTGGLLRYWSQTYLHLYLVFVRKDAYKLHCASCPDFCIRHRFLTSTYRTSSLPACTRKPRRTLFYRYLSVLTLHNRPGKRYDTAVDGHACCLRSPIRLNSETLTARLEFFLLLAPTGASREWLSDFHCQSPSYLILC